MLTRRWCWTFAPLVVLAGCTLPLVGDITPAVTPAQRERAEQRNVQALAEENAKHAAMEKIIVLPGDSSRPYRVLGVVKPELFLEVCDPDTLREAAVEKFGNVDAIIGFIQTPNGMGGPSLCEGTAVLFEKAE